MSNTKSNPARLLLFVASLTSAFACAACNTAWDFGPDFEKGGEGIQKAVDK